MPRRKREFDGQIASLEVNFIIDDPRCFLLSDAAFRGYICLWCAAVREKKEVLPERYNANCLPTLSKIVRIPTKKLKRIIEELQKNPKIKGDSSLILVNPEGRIRVVGVAVKNINFDIKGDDVVPFMDSLGNNKIPKCSCRVGLGGDGLSSFPSENVELGEQLPKKPDDEIEMVLDVLRKSKIEDYKNIKRDSGWEDLIGDYIQHLGLRVVINTAKAIILWLEDPAHHKRAAGSHNPKLRLHNWLKKEQPRPKPADDEPEDEYAGYREMPLDLEDHFLCTGYFTWDKLPKEYKPPPPDHRVWLIEEDCVRENWNHWYPGQPKPTCDAPGKE